MTVQIDKSSHVPIRLQISEQIVMSIVTGTLKPGVTLRSTREVARKLKISRNTVSAAYQDLVKRLYIQRHPGGKMIVRALGQLPTSAREDLDDLIDSAIRMAQERGYTLQQLGNQMRDRLLVQPPDHVLIAEEDPGMCQLLQRELRDMLGLNCDAVMPEDLLENHGKAIGALVLALPRFAQRVATLLPKHHPLLVLGPSSIDRHVKMIQQLKEPSVIGIVSVSQVFLKTARTLLAPFIGSLHSLEEHQLGETETRNLTGLDLVFCDTLTQTMVTARPGRLEHYRVISDAATKDISRQLASLH